VSKDSFCAHVSFLFTPDGFSLLFAATEATVEMSNRMAAVGADAVLVINPSYYKSAMNVSLENIYLYNSAHTHSIIHAHSSMGNERQREMLVALI
jgi:hypothetical protein